jgi:hypothetical protein
MFEITESTKNKDVPDKISFTERTNYLRAYYRNFKSKLPDPLVYPSKERSDIFILDFAQGPAGLKAYAAEKFIAEQYKTMGYAAVRVGHAPEAIAFLCEMYNKNVVFFGAASKQITPHQAVVLAYKNTNLRFAKIPAMPTMNTWIKNWAQKYDAVPLPMGLANTWQVTAGIVNIAETYTQKYGEPTQFYCAVSTGTMIRGLQLGWPNAEARGVAVARNIKDGEKGSAEVISYHKKFYAESDYMPNFNTTSTYDAKAYKHFIDTAKPGAVFINVGSDAQIEKRLNKIPGWENINAKREWGDKSAFDIGYVPNNEEVLFF